MNDKEKIKIFREKIKTFREFIKKRIEYLKEQKYINENRDEAEMALYCDERIIEIEMYIQHKFNELFPEDEDKECQEI